MQYIWVIIIPTGISREMICERKIKMDKRNYSNGLDIPLGLSMAMGQNPQAMEYFTHLTSEQKNQLIGSVHNVHSKSEMKRFVQKMADGTALTPDSTYTELPNGKFNI